MATTITLSRPETLDLQPLADTTRRSLALLKPWIDRRHSEDAVVIRVVQQAAKYVDAVQLTVAAAYSGFTVTEDVLYLASTLPESMDNKEDLDKYIVGMLELARESRANSNKALEAFRTIRTELIQAQEELNANRRELDQDAPYVDPENLLKDLKEDIENLNEFSKQIGGFADWWDWVKMETDHSRDSQPVYFHLDALRDPSTVRKWKDMRSKYTAYVQMIGEMQDSDPQFFDRSWVKGLLKTEKQTDENHSSHSLLGGMLIPFKRREMVQNGNKRKNTRRGSSNEEASRLIQFLHIGRSGGERPVDVVGDEDAQGSMDISNDPEIHPAPTSQPAVTEIEDGQGTTTEKHVPKHTQQTSDEKAKVVGPLCETKGTEKAKGVEPRDRETKVKELLREMKLAGFGKKMSKAFSAVTKKFTSKPRVGSKELGDPKGNGVVSSANTSQTVQASHDLNPET